MEMIAHLNITVLTDPIPRYLDAYILGIRLI
jgi:hypothetical protein